MDRQLEQQEKESFKSTIMMQDLTFRHQVQELHRLYNVQRKLMDELKEHSDSTGAQSATDQGQTIDFEPLSGENEGNLTEVSNSLVDFFNLETQAPMDEDCPGLNANDRPSASNAVESGSQCVNDADVGGKLDLALGIGLGPDSCGKNA